MMKRTVMCVLAMLLVAGAWAQNGPGPEGPKGGPKLTDQGFTETEAKEVQASLKTWEQANREWDADLQVLEAQRNRLMVKEDLDRGELEKTFRSQYEIFLKRDLARIDLMSQWRKAYGLDKSRFLDQMIRGPQPGQPGQPGQPNQPGQPQGPAPKKP